MSESLKRAIHFSDKIKSKLNKAFEADIHWEPDTPPSLKFVVIGSKEIRLKYEIRIKYDTTKDRFTLYDTTLGEFSSMNSTPSEIVKKVRKYVG